MMRKTMKSVFQDRILFARVGGSTIIISSSSSSSSRHLLHYQQTTSFSTTSSTDTPSPPSPPLPSPSGKWPIIGHLPRMIQEGDANISWASGHEECGDLFEMTVAGKEIVVTRNVQHARQILAHQGKDTIRTPQPAWRQVFDDQKWPHGIPFSEGDDWRRRRKVLGETLLMQKNAKEYIPFVLPAANRLIHCLEGHLNAEGRLNTTNTNEGNDESTKSPPPSSIRLLAGMFALEAVMKVVIGVDFKALDVPIPQDGQAFHKGVEDVFLYSSKVDEFPGAARFKIGPYPKLEKAWKTLYHYPNVTLAPVLAHYKEHGSLPAEVQGTVLPKLIAQHEEGEVSLDEVLGIGTQAIAAAIDTTGQTAEYLLYNLARNPDVQDYLADEIIAEFGKDAPLDATLEQYDRQNYLFATLKESMRLTPTIGVHARTLVQDAKLGEHTVPKGKLVLINFLAMTQDPDLFPQPSMFLPERFVRKKKSKQGDSASSSPTGCPMHQQEDREQAIVDGDALSKDAYAAIPFGHGGRKCSGKAFAELDIHILMMALLRKYRILYDGPDLVQRSDSLLRPVEDLTPHFQFVPR